MGTLTEGNYKDDVNWSAKQCVSTSYYVCQVLTNKQCPDGWDFVPNGNEGKCMKFYLGGESHLPWYDGYHYCKSIGAQMMMIENEMEQNFVTQETVFLIERIPGFARTIVMSKPSELGQSK